jgi:hypothetical protein
MKQFCISIVFLFFSQLNLFGQNWNTTPSSLSTYFIADKNIKYTAIDSVAIGTNNDSIYYFYKTIRDSVLWGIQNPNVCIDTNAASWMGYLKIRNDSNGIEKYLNYKGDTILFKTYAQLNDNWVLMTDTGNTSIVATISNVDTMTIDGVLDSIKEITLQKYINSTPDIAYYNSYKFILSKNNGWIAIIDLYCFNAIPNSITISYSLPIYNSNDLFIRVSKKDENTLHVNVDLNAKFTAGNEWQYSYLYTNNLDFYQLAIYDSIISATPLGNYKYNCTIRRRITGMMDSSFPQLHTVNMDTIFNQVTDSFFTCLPNNPSFNTSEQLFAKMVHPEIKYLPTFNKKLMVDTFMYNSFFITYSTSLAKFDFSNSPCVKIGFGFSFGYNKEAYKMNSKIGVTYYTHTTNLIDLIPDQELTLQYAKINNDIYGTKLNIGPSSIKETKQNTYSISPNPAKDILQINFKLSNANNTISIIGMDGKIIKHFYALQQNNIDISKLASGMYLINIASSGFNYFDKFIKE